LLGDVQFVGMKHFSLMFVQVKSMPSCIYYASVDNVMLM